MIKKRFISFLFIFLFLVSAFASEEADLYRQAVKAGRRNDLDFAFMNFHSLLTFYPGSRFKENALFALGEYYFLCGDYFDSGRSFLELVNNYPESSSRIFALAYLLEIARRRKAEESIDVLEKEIAAAKRLTLLFRDSKEYKYLSSLSRSHKALHFIDKLQFYIDDKLFTEVSY